MLYVDEGQVLIPTAYRAAFAGTRSRDGSTARAAGGSEAAAEPSP